MELTSAAIDQIAGLATVAGEFKYVEGSSVPFALVPNGYQLQEISRHMDTPQRVKQHVKVANLQEMEKYLSRFGTENTVIFADADPENGGVLAVIDYHQPTGSPAWGDHTVRWQPQPSTEWKEWTAASGQLRPQAAFALFIDSHIEDIAVIDLGDGETTPTPAVMLTIARRLSATRTNTTTWEAGENLETGDGMLTATQTTKGAVSGRDEIRIPAYFGINIPVFQGGEKYAQRVRFLYAVTDDGKLNLRADLPAAKRVWEAAFAAEMEKFKARGFMYPGQLYLGRP